VQFPLELVAARVVDIMELERILGEVEELVKVDLEEVCRGSV
jgi:hypothetical protein